VSSLDLGADFAAAVLQLEQTAPATEDPNTLAIDYLPADGQATIRVTRLIQVDAAQLRQLIADTAVEQPSVF
jgi:hypothetical protein